VSIRILEGDCREVLPTLAERFDCCITDPPYGDTSLDWDQVCDGWIEAVASVLNPAASLWVFGSMRFLAPLFSQMRDAGFQYSQDIVWEKQNGTGFHNDRFRRVHEHAVMFYRGKWADVYHDTQFTMDATARVTRRKARPAHTGNIGAAHYVSEDGGPRMQRSVIYCPNEHGNAVHPTQKPIEILLPLVRYSCPPGGSIVDAFGGSASTALAAKLEGRSCTCVEIDPGRAAVARERLRNDAPLFGEAA